MNLIDIWQDTPTLRLSVFVLLLDYIWFTTIGAGYYQGPLNQINMGEFPVRMYSAGLAYIALICGLNKLVLPLLTPDSSFKQVFKLTRTFALVVYGVFNFTNHAVMDKWDWQVSIIDLLWGVFMCTAAVWWTLQTGPKDDDDEDDE